MMLQTTRFFSGRYLAEPTLVLNLGESASLGTGTAISTPLATDCFLNCALAWEGTRRRGSTGGLGPLGGLDTPGRLTLTMISTRLWENFSMTDSIQMSGLARVPRR